MSALFVQFNKKFMKKGNVICEMHEEEIVLSLEYFVPGPNGLAIGLYCLIVCCDALRTSPCVVQTSVIGHLQILFLCFEGDIVRKEHLSPQSVYRGEFRPRQTRQLPRAVDLKGRLLSCQSY